MAVVDLLEAREAWNLGEAVAYAQPGNLFPSRVAWSAVQDNARVIQVLDGSARTGLKASAIEIVPVPKADRATRSAADMPIEDQIVYAALVEAIRSALPDDLVAFTGQNQSYADFERFPLDVESPSKYVFEGDVVSFYEYVSHERLLTELVGLTGLAGVAEGLIDLLEAWLPGERGLPQGPGPSAPLADIYIAPVSRALARAGFVHSRYSDDFRVPVNDYNQLRELQLLLEQALRDLGLTLSSLKVRTPKIETYRRNLEQIPDSILLSPLAREVLETVEVDEYFGGAVIGAADVSEEEVQRAAQVFGEQLQVVGVEVVNTRLMRWSLGRLGTAGSDLPLAEFPLLLRRYAHLTQTIAAYVQVVMGTNLESRAVGTVIDWIQDPSFKFPWQIGWLLNAVAHAHESYKRLGTLTVEILFTDAVPWFVRGQAAIVSATERALPAHTRVFDVYERAPKATKPDLLAAVVIQQPTWGPSFLQGARTSPVHEAIAEMNRDEYPSWI